MFLENAGFNLNVFSNDVSDKIIEKLCNGSVILDDLVHIKAGLKAYQTGKGKPKQTAEVVKQGPFDFNFKLDDNTYKYLEGKDVLRYGLNWSKGYLQFGPHLAEPRIFHGPKLIIREITGTFPRCLNVTYTDQTYLFNISNIAIVPRSGSSVHLKYVLALLNSKLLSYYFIKNTAKSVRQMFPKLILKDLRVFPIKVVSEQQQISLIEIADEILAAKENSLQTDTSLLESEIDQLVYKLYDLTEDEIKIIEQATK